MTQTIPVLMLQQTAFCFCCYC